MENHSGVLVIVGLVSGCATLRSGERGGELIEKDIVMNPLSSQIVLDGIPRGKIPCVLSFQTPRYTYSYYYDDFAMVDYGYTYIGKDEYEKSMRDKHVLEIKKTAMKTLLLFLTVAEILNSQKIPEVIALLPVLKGCRSSQQQQQMMGPTVVIGGSDKVKSYRLL